MIAQLTALVATIGLMVISTCASAEEKLPAMSGKEELKQESSISFIRHRVPKDIHLLAPDKVTAAKKERTFRLPLEVFYQLYQQLQQYRQYKYLV